MNRVRSGIVRAIAGRDVARVMRSPGVRIPLLVFPLILLIVLPAFMVGAEQLLGRVNPGVPLESTPFGGLATEAERIAGAVPFDARWAVFVLEIFMAPLFLLVPLAVSTVIAADSFAGERERGTLEPILHSPITDRELLLGKFIAAWLPATVVAGLGFVVYSVTANLLAWPAFGRVFFPDSTWVVLALWVAPGLAALGLGAMVVISIRVRSLQAAHQLGSLGVIPVLLLLVGQVTGVARLRLATAVLLGGLVWVLTFVVLAVGFESFSRDRLTGGISER